MVNTQSVARLHRFHGGLRLAEHKNLSTVRPVMPAHLPAYLVLPLQQHIGRPAKPVVRVGDQVLKGQLLAQAEDYISANLHAPSSGRISAIEQRPIAHPSGLNALCVVLEADGADTGCEPMPALPDYRAVEPALLRRRVRDAGIVGLGGAAFPSAVKLNPGPNVRVRQLILNAAECEPYITCDDMLMREKAHEIIGGLLVIRHILQAEEVLIGIEDNKPEARQALEQALAEYEVAAGDVHIRSVPTVYPAGGEKQLIRVLTGREVPSHGIPAEIGIVCHNIATAAAVYAAVYEGRPLISRYLTVTGDGVMQPQVLEVRIGTPASELIAQCGGYRDGVQRLIMGGPMMGVALASDEVPVVKGSNCLLALTTPVAEQTVMPCIRCGACVDVCPANLLPQQLYWYARAKDFDKVQDYKLFDCIECGCCSVVCPSKIPLVHYFRFAKTEIWTQEREREKADQARRRHEFRLERLEREQVERAAKMRKKKEALKITDKTAEDPKKAAIQAALERAKAKKAAAEAQDE